jgi:DNA repair exonuclease SbcCD ATPase subunit
MSLEISSAGKKMADAQTRVFTKWVNARLTQLAAQRQENGTSEKANPIVLCENLLTDLRDGTLLINLTEAVTGKKFRVNKGRTQAHQINNIQLALQCLESFGVDLTSITEHLINEGNSKATLGLIWKILTFYNRKQMSENSKHQQAGTSTGLRKELLSWCQMNLIRYKLHGVEVTDFGPSWKDGLALTALLHQFKPEQVHIEDLKELAPNDRLEVAFAIAKEEFGVEKLLLPEDLELFPDKETGSGSPRKQLDESLVLTYISELHNQIIKQFPHGPDTESKPLNEDVHEMQEDDVASQTIDHGLTLAPLDSWIKEGQQLMEEELDQEVEREDRDTSPVAKIEVHLQKSDTILSEVSSDIDEHSSSLPPNDAQDLQDRYTELQEQMTNVKKLLTVRLTELKFKECVVDIHHWVSESDSLLTKLKTKDTFGCAEEVEEQLSQYEAVFNEDNATHGHSAVDRLRELAEQLNGFDTWNRRLETRTVVSRESKRVNAMAGGIAEYGELLRVWMNQWETVDRDCALLDGWLSKAELLLGKSEDAETSFALGPQAFMESYQDVLRNYVAHQDLLASLETSMEQVGANANQRAKVETLNKIFRELKQNDLESWLRIYQLFFDKILAWISQADQVESLSVEDSFREKSPPSVCQELLDQLPEVLQAFSECEGKANSDTQCPEWFSEQLMASKLKLSELKEQLEEQLENVQISCEGGEEFKAAVTKLEAKIEKANELTSQDFDSEMSMSVTVAIDKYQVLCDPEWLQDGDNILKEAEEFADQIMKTGKNRGAAQLEQKLVNLSKTWKSTKDKLTSKQRELQFESLQAELDAHMNDGLQLLDGLESVGPLDNLLEQQENYRVLFEEIQFESGAQSYLKKLLELTEEEKQGNPDGELSTYFDQIVSDLREKLTAVMKRAMAMKDKLDESVHKWRTFETEKQEVEVWIKEKGSQLSEITSSCETEWSELDDINRVLQQAMQLTEEIDKYGDWLRRFLDSGEQLKDECDANQSVEHENGLKHLEGRFEQLRLEVDKLTHPLLALQSSWHSFNSLSGEIEAWLDDAHGLLQECSEVEDIKETEQCVKKHKEFFTEPTLKLQNSKITHLSQLLQEFKTPQGGSDQIHHPTHLPDQLQNLIDRYTQICQLQKSELEYLETLWRYLQVATDISQYLHEIELLLSDLDSNSQSPDSLERLQAMLQELMPKRERLGQLKGMHSRLEQIREGRNVPVSLDEMDHRFEEVKARQAAVFERRETEEEAEELISEVKQDIKRARETLTYVIECEAEKENAQIERLQRINSVLNSHKRSISDLIAKLTDRGSTQSCLQNLTDLMSELDAATGELVSAEDICQEASILVDDMKKAVKEVEDQVSKVDTALEIPWRKDSTSRRLALQDCQSAVSGAQMSHQQLNLSEAQRLLNELTTLISPTHVVHVADTLSKSKAEWEAAVKRGHGRIQMIQFEQLMLEAREKINTADAHLKQLEPILGPTSRVEEKLQSHLEFFLDNFETAMDSVRNALATFMESSPSEGDELTKHDVQEKLDELCTQIDTLQSEQKRLELSMKKALAEWQQFDKKQNEFTNWLKGAEKHFEGLRDESSKGNNKEGMLSLVAEIQSKEVSLKLVLDAGHELCQVCIEPNDSHLKQALNELKIQFNQLRSQANAVADAQSDEAEQIEDYRKKAEFVKTWLEDVDKQQRQTKAKEHVGEGDRKVLQVSTAEECKPETQLK